MRASRIFAMALVLGSQSVMAGENSLLREYGRLAEENPSAAQAFARDAEARAKVMSRNDPRRADALDIFVRSQIADEQFAAAWPIVTELLLLRRNARPVDHERLAHALGLQGTVLFALDRSADADRAFREQLVVWRRAYPANDLRLARALESHARNVQEGFGRPRFALELYREAFRIRTLHPRSSPGKLAEIAQTLALQQMALFEYIEADAHLAQAGKLLEVEAARDPNEEEAKAGLAQVLVLRAALAVRLARREQAQAFVAMVRQLEFRDRVLRVETELLVAASMALVLEKADLPAAIAELNRVLEAFDRNADLVQSGALDGGGIGDTQGWLAKLYLDNNELDRAQVALAAARRQLGDTSDLLFSAAELERKRGREPQALELYQKALRQRKESASEVTVLFGTNREPESGAEAARFGAGTSASVTLGEAVVLVPGGGFSSDGAPAAKEPLIPVGPATDPEQLFIRAKAVLDAEHFRALARTKMTGAKLYPDAALVFVHGFNVKFDAALQRGAQLVRDLNFDGPLFVFSWPSRGDWKRYGSDRATAGSVSDALVDFLATVADASGAAKIHVIAHSMGNRVVLPALVKVAGTAGSPVRGRLSEVILAAPAVPEGEFAAWLKVASHGGSPRFTLYASAFDKAMVAGYLREWGTVLAGHVANGEPLLHSNVESIDISQAGSTAPLDLNHDVFASNPVMTEDMRQLLQRGQRPPSKRIPALQTRTSKNAARTYWYYVRR